MARIKENKMLIESVTEDVERKPAGTFNEMMVFHLGVIASVLADISKSLAVIADKAEMEDKE